MGESGQVAIDEHVVGIDPVIAAGGIGDARGVAAVLALGAQAAWLGTRFLLAEEMPIHEDYRRRLIAAAETDPQLYPNLYSVGWPDSPHRALRNSTAGAREAAGRSPLAQRPGYGEVIAHFASGEAIVRYEPALPGVVADPSLSRMLTARPRPGTGLAAIVARPVSFMSLPLSGVRVGQEAVAAVGWRSGASAVLQAMTWSSRVSSAARL